MYENDLKWVTNEKNILLFLKDFHENFRSKTTRFQEIKLFSEMRNDALMHRELFNGLIEKQYLTFLLHLIHVYKLG